MSLPEPGVEKYEDQSDHEHDSGHGPGEDRQGKGENDQQASEGLCTILLLVDGLGARLSAPGASECVGRHLATAFRTLDQGHGSLPTSIGREKSGREPDTGWDRAKPCSSA